MKYLKTHTRSRPYLRDFLLRIYNLYFEYRQILIGNVIRIPAYVRHLFASKVIAGPGSVGFAGGIFNPGALLLDDKVLLLARSQIIPWYKARGKKANLYLQGSPIIITLDKDSLDVKVLAEIRTLVNFPDENKYSAEDFRLFHWKNKIYVNHSVIVKKSTGKYIEQESVKTGLSLLDSSGTFLKFVGFPQLDFEVQNLEKNWMYKEYNGNLFLFYSVNPYRVLTNTDKDSLQFTTVHNTNLNKRLRDPGQLGTMVSFSTNPIDFDNLHWLIIVHQIEHKASGRCYHHWVVLIDKTTLLPTKITRKQIFSGMGARGRTPGIRYITSVLKQEKEILFFAGEGDIYTTVARRKITEIEALFVNLH